MTPPTLHELAGIVMLAFVTTALLVFPSSGKSHVTPPPASLIQTPPPVTIDGIESLPLISEQPR